MLKNYIIPTVLLTSFMLMSFTTFKHDYNNSAIEKLDLFQKKDTVTWKQLARIDFVKKKDKAFGEVMFPVINASLKTKQGKKIVAKGFIVPIDNKTYALSKNVFAQCFFCGNAGPETIMGLKFKGKTPKLKTDQYVTIEGNFRYNDSNVEDWIYHIDNAVIVKGK